MNEKILIPRKDIQSKVNALALQIAVDYKNKDLVLVGVLNGAFIFLSDLARELFKNGVNPQLYFVGVSSYVNSTNSSKQPKLTSDMKGSIEGKDVLIVEDIIDAGHTVYFLLEHLQRKKPNSIKVCSLLSKRSRREKEIEIDYLGFEIENVWVEGYGMDTEGKFRGSPDILQRT